jgi:hypothetical protein
VTRDDDRYRIAAVRRADRARRRAVAESMGKLSVAPGAAGPNPAKGLPDLPLEQGATCIHRDAIDRGQVAGQVGADLPADPEWVPRPHPRHGAVARGHRADHTGPSELECTQASVTDRDHDAPDRALDLIDKDGTGKRSAHVISYPGWR